MATVIGETTITNRLTHYHTAHPTAEAKRQLALGFITPYAEIPEYAGLDVVRYHLSLLWALDRGDDKIVEAASHLWRIPPATKDFAGQRAVIFSNGGQETVADLKNGDVLSLVLGVLPKESEIRHKISGKRSALAQPSFEGVKAPYATGSATIPLLHSRQVFVTRSAYDVTDITPDEIEVPIYEAVAHVGDDQTYAAETAETRIYHVLIGNAAVKGFGEELARSVTFDSRAAITSLKKVFQDGPVAAIAAS